MTTLRTNQATYYYTIDDADPVCMRRCSKCLYLLPIAKFPRDGDGHGGWCNDCHRNYIYWWRRRGGKRIRSDLFSWG